MNAYRRFGTQADCSLRACSPNIPCDLTGLDLSQRGPAGSTGRFRFDSATGTGGAVTP